jgi:hypothetical protein
MDVSPQLQHFGTVYTELKYWLPLVTIVTIGWKAKAAITTWADSILNNHLHSIQVATQSTEVETKKTNSILVNNTDKLDVLAANLSSHQEKEAIVWQGVVNTLTILEDRTRSSRTPKKRVAYAKSR